MTLTKTRLLPLFFMLCFQAASAQFAIIAIDKGEANVRNSPTLGNNIIDRLYKGQIIAMVESVDENWVKISYVKAGVRQQGFLSTSILLPVSFDHPIQVSILNDNQIEFRTDKLQLILTKTYFTVNNKKFNYCQGVPVTPIPKYLCQINGKTAYGNYGKIPREEYRSVNLTYLNKTSNFPIAGLYEPRLECTELFYDDASQTFYLVAKNGHEKDPYTVIWVIKSGVLLQQSIV